MKGLESRKWNASLLQTQPEFFGVKKGRTISEKSARVFHEYERGCMKR